MATETARIEDSLQNSLQNLQSIETQAQGLSPRTIAPPDYQIHGAPDYSQDDMVERWQRLRRQRL